LIGKLHEKYIQAAKPAYDVFTGSRYRKIEIKKYLLVIALGLVLFNGAANAAGCLKGAAVGAVAGHIAGHHTVLGAVGGCIVGRHLANKKAAQEKESAQMQTIPAK
jgi:outer membrane lipoprotein SlyB